MRGVGPAAASGWRRQQVLLAALIQRTNQVAAAGRRALHTTQLQSSSQGDGVERGYRSAGWWVPEHQPDKNPGDDPELRRKAALKYGLLPQDYKPFTDDGTGWGNYPDLGTYTSDHKDPYEDWSNHYFKRNWGEPVHRDWDLYRPDRQTWTGIDDRENIKWWLPTSILIYGTFFFAIFQFTKSFGHTNAMMVLPYMPKQYPYDLKRGFPYEDPRNYPITNFVFESADAPDHHDHH